MLIEKINHNGYIVISDIIDNQLVKKIYVDYSITEAEQQFKSEYSLKD